MIRSSDRKIKLIQHVSFILLISVLVLEKGPAIAAPVDFELKGKVFTFEAKTISNGFYKSAHGVLERPELVLVKSRRFESPEGAKSQLEEEMNFLAHLARKKVNVVDFQNQMVGIKGNKFFLLEEGMVLKDLDSIGYVLNLYAAGSKDLPSKKFIDLFNDRSIRDLAKNSFALIEKRLLIIDLQFLISDKGKVVLSDPLGWSKIYYFSKWYKSEENPLSRFLRYVAASKDADRKERARMFEVYDSEIRRLKKRKHWKRKVKVLKRKVRGSLR